MLEGVIFDLDETLVNTGALKNFRRLRNWQACYENLNLTKIYDQAGALLEMLRSEGVKIGIVTMSPRPYALKVLKYHGITYDCLIAYHDCAKKKPYPDPILKCISNLGISPERTISIGDDIKDLKASKEANVFTVASTWGNSALEELKHERPDLIVNSFDELFSVVRTNFLIQGENV
jgi:HAD superfamily hydrolase (TIGR01662 family)